MLKLALAGLILLLVGIAFLAIVRNKPDLWFWLFLNMYFDPGGYIYGFMGGNLVGPLNTYDVFFGGMIVCTLFAKINWKTVFLDITLKRFLFYLSLFGAYFYIVYGGIVPYYNNDFDYISFFIKNRYFAYGFILLIAIYAFSLRSLYYFYTTTLFIGVVALTLYLISLLTGVNLVPIEEMARNPGEDMMRISIMSYGIFYLLFPVSLITYLLSRKYPLYIPFKPLLYYSGIIMIVTMLLTLTRRTQIEIIGMAIIITVIIAVLFRTGKLSEILKLIVPGLLVVIVLSLIFPKYLGYLADIGEDTFLLITTGRDSKGETDQRVSGSDDYKIVEQYIKDNLFFGTGYTYLNWRDGRAYSVRGEQYSVACDAAGEVPIYYALFGYGLLGSMLLLPLYFKMGKLAYDLLRILKLKFINYLHDPLILIFSIYTVLTIAINFTIRFYTLSLDFNAPHMGQTAVLLGVGFALYRKITDDKLNNDKIVPDKAMDV